MALILGVILWLAPSAAPVSSTPAATAATAAVATTSGTGANVRTVTADITKIVEQRCYLCHGEKVQMKNIRLDSAELLQKNAVMVYQQVAITKQMPMGNSTGMTPEERKILGDWAKP